jgi:selenocysteine lyase/cysteine desulfurase
MKLPSQRHLFDIPEDITYLNCAYMSPLMTKVRDAVVQGLNRKQRPWQIAARDFYEGSDELRSAFAELIHARADDIAIVAAASYGVSTAAKNLPLSRGQGVLVVADQFPSNVYPWRELAREREATVVTLPRPADFDWTRAVLEALDEKKNRIAVVALPQCHWTDGGLFDLAAIGAACRERGTFLSLDVTQSAGAFPLDVRRIQPDFLTAATYKWLMGTYSLGLLYVSERWQREGRPIEHNWIHRKDSENFARLVEYQEAFDSGARRFDVGERSNFALVPGATAAIRQILEWGVENVSETIGALTQAIGERTQPLGLGFVPRDKAVPHFIGLRFPGELPGNLLEALARRKVYVSVRGTSVRVTPHVYNDARDVERLAAALEEVLS